MNRGATTVMKMGAAQTYELPQAWTVRKVVSAMAREWLAPFRPEVAGKPARWTARWMVQPVVEEPAQGEPLWEEGIATAEYERRLERPDLAWSVQAKSGRAQGLILARLCMNPNNPGAFDMVCFQDSLPETLFDADKLAAFLEAHRLAGAGGLFAGLLLEHGFRVASPELT